MKTALIVLSLLGNVALAVVLIKRPQAESTLSSAAEPVALPLTAGATDAKSDVSVPSAQDAATLKRLWPLVQAGDLVGVVAQLRSMGFPPDVLRAVVRALVYEQNRPKWRELQADDGGPFWRTPAYNRDPKRIAALRELNREQQNRVKELLGPDAEAAPAGDLAAAQALRRYGNMDPEKVAKSEEINRDYNDLAQDVYTLAMGGGGGMLVLLPEDREKLTYLDKQKHDDLAKVLLPEELLEYDLRNSNTATRLRQQLMGFSPTQEEFVAIFKLQQAMDERLGATQLETATTFQQRQAALKDLQPQIDAALGPERAALYKQTTDPQYAQVSRIVGRLELPPTATSEVISVQKDIQQRAVALRMNASLSAADRAAQMSTLADEASGKLTTVLGGARGLEAYKQYGGAWLQTLTRPMPTRPPGF